MTNFNLHCEAITKEFIQNVIVIDDEFSYFSPNIEELIEPTEPTSFEDSPIVSDQTVNQTQPSPSTLNLKDLIDSFFEEQIVAGYLKPDTNLSDSFYEKALHICNKVDGIILDWHLSDDNPNSSIELIKRIIENDYNNGGRLRVIIIYTSQGNFTDLSDQLCNELKRHNIREYMSEQPVSFNLEENGISTKNTRITFHSKGSVPVNNLPSIIIKEFSKNVNGLLPTFALKSTTAIRASTHHLITRFNKDLDTAYLAHRAMIPHAEDAEPFMLENFSSVIRNILSLEQVDIKCLGNDAINLWAAIEQQNFEGVCNEKNISITPLELLEAVSNGRKNILTLIKSKLGVSAKAFKALNEDELLTQIAEILNSDKNKLHHFTVLSSFKRSHLDIGWAKPDHPPYLTQGTIIYNKDDEKYFLCVTPKCDSVRISCARSFSFFELPKLSSNTKIHIIVRNINEYIELSCSRKFYQLTHINFNSDINTKRVEGVFEERTRSFYFTAENEKYYWIGDLKDLTTQAHISGLVENINRVGVDEFEWFRISKL